jgi:hypothetical protein
MIYEGFYFLSILFTEVPTEVLSIFRRSAVDTYLTAIAGREREFEWPNILDTYSID